MPIHLWLAFVTKLAAGIVAISASYAPVEPARATAYAVAATYHGLKAGVDPFELVGIARNESDFIEKLRGPDGKDCGLTQTRITNSRFSCRELNGSYWIAFQEAARELSEYARACRGARDYDRCRINRYNSGVRYARTGVHGGYYARVLCFAEAARVGSWQGRATCRRARKLSDIRRYARAPLGGIRTASAEVPATAPGGSF
jgi:hypothetical protein